MGRSSKLEAIAGLRAEYEKCDRCYLDKRRTHVVFGDGNPDTKLVIVGEAPGHSEDKTGRPF